MLCTDRTPTTVMARCPAATSCHSNDGLGTQRLVVLSHDRVAGPLGWTRFDGLGSVAVTSLRLSDDGQLQCDRVVERYGSRAERQRLRFDRSGRCARHADSDVAAHAVEVVERRLWRFAAGLSMLQRGLYAGLLRVRAVAARVVSDGGQPIAFRLNAHRENACPA